MFFTVKKTQEYMSWGAASTKSPILVKQKESRRGSRGDDGITLGELGGDDKVKGELAKEEEKEIIHQDG